MYTKKKKRIYIMIQLTLFLPLLEYFLGFLIISQSEFITYTDTHSFKSYKTLLSVLNKLNNKNKQETLLSLLKIKYYSMTKINNNSKQLFTC